MGLGGTVFFLLKLKHGVRGGFTEGTESGMLCDCSYMKSEI